MRRSRYNRDLRASLGAPLPKFRHKVYPQPHVLTNAGSAVFVDHVFETKDKAIAAELRRNPDIEEIKAPAKPKAK